MEAPPSTITTIAPSAAPEDTPITAGSASGFRNSPWNSIPETPRAAPTSTARATRGSRSWSRITSRARSTPSG